MFKNRWAVCTLLLQLSCGKPLTPSPPPFVGRWRATSFSMDVPQACQEASVEFRADGTMITRSGDQTLTAHYVAQGKRRTFVLTLSGVRVNDRPNCQGIPSELVLKYQVSQLYLDVSGDTVRVRGGPDAPSFVMTRLP
jgi:hypothetical protein